ncbi:MAG: TolB-like protein [Paraglaciecola sp.]|jgi:TolB-like protein
MQQKQALHIKIAVLPFVNFRDAITEEIMNALAKIQKL